MGEVIKFGELAKDPSKEIEEGEISFEETIRRNGERKKKLAQDRAKENEKVKREYRLKGKK